ncbi:hypothetical protein KCV00_g286, partial [Aureobasidium melanogenum]
MDYYPYQILDKASKIIGDETHIPSGISIRLREQENLDHTPADFDGRTDQQRNDLTQEDGWDPRVVFDMLDICPGCFARRGTLCKSELFLIIVFPLRLQAWFREVLEELFLAGQSLRSSVLIQRLLEIVTPHHDPEQDHQTVYILLEYEQCVQGSRRKIEGLGKVVGLGRVGTYCFRLSL